jgi:hypothetical protein
MAHMRVLRAGPRMLAFCGAMLCLVGVGFAQNTNSGEIRGNITDPTGAAVPSANVMVLDVDTCVSRDCYTNSVGLYDTVSILPGTYRISVSKEGISMLVRDGITLEVGSPLTIDATLSVGTSSKHIQISGEAPLVKTGAAEQSSSLGAEIKTELPYVREPGKLQQNVSRCYPSRYGWLRCSLWITRGGSELSTSRY